MHSTYFFLMLHQCFSQYDAKAFSVTPLMTENKSMTIRWRSRWCNLGCCIGVNRISLLIMVDLKFNLSFSDVTLMSSTTILCIRNTYLQLRQQENSQLFLPTATLLFLDTYRMSVVQARTTHHHDVIMSAGLPPTFPRKTLSCSFVTDIAGRWKSEGIRMMK